MAHFAQLDENNIVLQIIVVNNNELLNENGVESEQKGIDFCTSLFGGVWVQTSYNTLGGLHANGGTPLNKNYAGIGYSWDGTGFAAPQPYPSWTLDKETYLWTAPVAMPTDGKPYTWNEDSKSWDEVTLASNA